jgi:beta-glucosidase
MPIRLSHRPARLVFCSVLGASSLFGAAPPSSGLFIHDLPLAPIYHGGWIDLDKNGVKDPYEDPTVDIEKRIDDLLARMTLEEKTAEMATLYGYSRVSTDALPTPAWKQKEWKDGIGNIDEEHNGIVGKAAPATDFDWPPSRHVRALNEVQRFFIEDTRLGVPADFTNEGIRGLNSTGATSFPCELAVGSTWDRELVSAIGHTTGREGRALGYTNVYSPVVDLARDPRWGRTPDSYSEDPFLDGELAYEEVRAIQAEHVVSTVKHFAIYSIPKGGRDGPARTDPQATWNEVETLYLAPFRRAIRDAGALGVMASYNDYNGVPVDGSSLFLTDILRQELGFRGYVVSDSRAVEFIHGKHRVAPTVVEAVRESTEAGLNVRTDFTPPEDYVFPLRQLVHEGRLSQATIDSRVRDILRVKFWLGLFDRPYVDPAHADAKIRLPEARAAAARAARESIVLLKNAGGLLPLRHDLKRVLVTGPLADNPTAWPNRYGPQHLVFTTVLAGLRRKLGPQCDIRYEPGCAVIDDHYPDSDVLKDPPSDQVRAGITAAANAAKGMDAAIVVLGETDAICSEAHGRTSLNLPGYQEELLEAVQATGTPVVLVLSNGRPLSVNWAARHVPAIVEMWFPGDQGGDAVADVLLGDTNPSGRLSITFPKTVGQIPFNFPAKPGSQDHDVGMVDGALFPFGFGLSYTTFGFDHLQISPERQGTQGQIEVACDVSNRGSRAGDEVVQLYLRDDYSSVTTYDKMLRGFARVHLAPGETRTAHFVLTPENLALYDRDQHWTVEPGRFTVMVGASSEDIRLRGNFTITRPDGTAPVEDLLPDEKSSGSP